jgi:MarR family transcriptional regulator, lower aerobic nicotinate degradation pathway regulator
MSMTSRPRAAAASEYRLDDQVGFLLRVAMQRHTSIFMSRIVKGLTQTQFAALAKLREVGSCSQNQLGRLIYLDAATTKGVVDRLERRGLVTARPDASDRRRRAIALTDAGRAVAAAAVKVARQITNQTLTPLTAAEQKAVIRLLRKLT